MRPQRRAGGLLERVDRRAVPARDARRDIYDPVDDQRIGDRAGRQAREIGEFAVDRLRILAAKQFQRSDS